MINWIILGATCFIFLLTAILLSRRNKKLDQTQALKLRNKMAATIASSELQWQELICECRHLQDYCSASKATPEVVELLDEWLKKLEKFAIESKFTLHRCYQILIHQDPNANRLEFVAQEATVDRMEKETAMNQRNIKQQYHNVRAILQDESQLSEAALKVTLHKVSALPKHKPVTKAVMRSRYLVN